MGCARKFSAVLPLCAFATCDQWRLAAILRAPVTTLLATLRACAVVSIATVACAGPPDSATAALSKLRADLAQYGLEPTPLPTSVATLAWQLPGRECAHAYRITSTVDPPLLHEDASIATIALATKADAPPVTEPPAPGEAVAFDLFYRGLRAEKRGLFREGHGSRELLGPAAPTAACTARTWDPVEDALALGWPRLPGRLTAVDEIWTGLRVEGKCNRSACVDPTTGAGGPDNHHRPCVTMSWRETLDGIYEIAGERVALVRSHWDDGHDGKGLQSDRVALVSIDHGRPLLVRNTLQHRFPELTIDNSFRPVVRTWVMESADDCPGSLAALGVSRRPGDVDAVSDVLTQLADVEAARERERRGTRVRDPDQPDPFAEE